MLAADKLLLRSTVKQKTIELREKELNLFNSNFGAVATQAALLAGFSMAFLEMSVHLHTLHYNPLAKALLHLFSVVCICANIYTVSCITFVSVWGSGKALRGRDGSMSKVVEGMNKERWVIFRSFGIGLVSLLSAVACATHLLMRWEVAYLSSAIIVGSCVALIRDGMRIFKKFELQAGELVRFDDFLKMLPRVSDGAEDDDDLDQEEMDEMDPRALVV